MDERTAAVYEARAAQLSAVYRAITPVLLYRVIQTFFHPGESTADIGCGSGRDTDWLSKQAYSVSGYDASEAMLAEARRHYPGVVFTRATLPDLTGLADGAFGNVLCSAVLMHVPAEDLITAAINLARILRPGGRLVVSYRASRGADEREPDGRLFTALPPGKLILLLETVGLQVLHSEIQPDATRPGVQWQVLAAEKSPQVGARGLERVQNVLVQDRKVATYKFALIRALCAISRTSQHLARWGQGEVYVPLWSIAVQWLTYYWPLLAGREFIAQARGELLPNARQLSFRPAVQELAERFGPAGLYGLLRELDEAPEAYRSHLRQIADAIRHGPVHYSGTHAPRLFRYERDLPAGMGLAGFEGQFGWVVVPESIWLDISRFDVWIEDSLVLRWASLTADMNPGTEARDYIHLLLRPPAHERDTAEVRTLLSGSGEPLLCVWTERRLSTAFEVDHVIPYSAWGNNDWWNLLPASAAANGQKSDALPTQGLLRRRRDLIVEYWRRYRRHAPVVFERQVGRALGLAVGQSGWEGAAFAGLQEMVERVASVRGLERWEP